MDVLAELTKSFPRGDVATVHELLDRARVEGHDRIAYFRIAEWLEADAARLRSRLDAAGPTASALGDMAATASRAHRGMVVTMMRDEASTVTPWLGHYHRLGFRRVVLVDHLSADGTADLARAAAERLGLDLVVIDERNPNHQQAQMMTGAARYGLSRWGDVDWVFPLDADEFLACNAPLPDLLAPLTADAVNLLMVNHVSAVALEAGLAADPDQTLLDAVNRGVPACMYKVAVRAEVLGRLTLTQGSHFLEGGGHSTVSGLRSGLILRHIANRDAPNFLRKVQSAIAIGYGDPKRPQVGGGHWAMWATMLQTQGQDALLGSWGRRQSGLLRDSRQEPAEVLDSFREGFGQPRPTRWARLRERR